MLEASAENVEILHSNSFTVSAFRHECLVSAVWCPCCTWLRQRRRERSALWPQKLKRWCRVKEWVSLLLWLPFLNSGRSSCSVAEAQGSAGRGGRQMAASLVCAMSWAQDLQTTLAVLWGHCQGACPVRGKAGLYWLAVPASVNVSCAKCWGEECVPLGFA